MVFQRLLWKVDMRESICSLALTASSSDHKGLDAAKQVLYSLDIFNMLKA